VERDGSAKEVVNDYEATASKIRTEELEQMSGSITFASWYIKDSRSNTLDLESLSGPLTIRFDAFAKKEVTKGILVIILRSGENAILWSGMYTELQIRPGAWKFDISFESLPLHPGIYSWETRFYDGHSWLDHPQSPQLSIVSGTDADIFSYLKGSLNLDVSFDLLDQTDCEVNGFETYSRD